MDEIDRQTVDYCNEWKNKRIRRVNSVVEQIEILIHESKVRLDNDYYNFALEELRLIYYAFSKLSDAVWGNGYSGLVDFHYLQNSVERIADLSACNSSQEVYVVLKAGFFAKNSDLCRQT